jgi:hypothetical protein
MPAACPRGRRSSAGLGELTMRAPIAPFLLLRRSKSGAAGAAPSTVAARLEGHAPAWPLWHLHCFGVSRGCGKRRRRRGALHGCRKTGGPRACVAALALALLRRLATSRKRRRRRGALHGCRKTGGPRACVAALALALLRRVARLRKAAPQARRPPRLPQDWRATRLRGRSGTFTASACREVAESGAAGAAPSTVAARLEGHAPAWPLWHVLNRQAISGRAIPAD